MMDRLEVIRERQDFCQRHENPDVAHITQDQAGWLISEVDRLRAEVERLRGNIVTIQSLGDEVMRLKLALRRGVEALEKIASQTEDMFPPFRHMPPDRMASIAAEPLALAKGVATPSPADRENPVLCGERPDQDD